MRINSQELDLYRGIIKDLHDGKELGYSELERELLINFGIRITKKELIQLDEPTMLDSLVDLKIQYRNIN